MNKTDKCRSWFCVLNNPQKEYPDSEPKEIAEAYLSRWIDEEHPTRSGAVAYCISAEGLEHLHLVLEDTNQTRFTAVQKAFPGMHIEPTKGSKEQAEDYIHKRGKFEEKGEQVIYIAQHGEIKGAQGQRKDLEAIGDLIEQGKTPKEIMRMNIGWRRYEKLIKDAYYDKRNRETPVLRDVNVCWHVGESGTGKTYTFVKLCEESGEDSVYMLTDYDNGGLDYYNGELILFMDEFRGQMKFSQLLGMLHGYKQQLHARYGNIYGLWTDVHISSVLPPEMVYENMVKENQSVDTQKQLFRRISYIIYHGKDEKGYYEYKIPCSEYKDYATLKQEAEAYRAGGEDGFLPVPDGEPTFGDL